MAAPTKAAAIATQDMEPYNKVAAENNKTKPVILSQESGKTAGFVVQNSKTDSRSATLGNTPPTAATIMAATASDDKAANNEASTGTNTTKPLNSSQESRKTAGWIARNNKMDSVDITQSKTPPLAPTGAATLQENIKKNWRKSC